MEKATLVLLNGNVLTLDPSKPKAEAIAICNDKILDVGKNSKIKSYVSEKTQIIDLKGKTVIPGLTDCHTHMLALGWTLTSLNLRDVKSIKELKRKLKEFARKKPSNKWILGGRWDQEKFAEKRYPTRWDLDSVIPNRPVFLLRVCGHIAVCNSKALQLAGIDKNTIPPSGGSIDKDAKTGKPTGILRENALEFIWRVIPKPVQEEIEEICLLACKKAVENGLTCVHWIASSPKEIRAIFKLYRKKQLPLRVYFGVPVEYFDNLAGAGLTTGFGNEMVKIGFVKILADGSLGGRTAALNKPYADKPETRGMLLYGQRRLTRIILKAHETGFQVAIHAIGDRALKTVLKAFENALSEASRNECRHRVEHVSLVNKRLLNRMKRLGIIVSVQPHFIISDFWITDRLGKKRACWTYVFKTFLRHGLIVIGGSDCPVEPINPLLGIWAAVARKISPKESLTVEEALRLYTVNAAYASFEENTRGTIEKGKWADLTVLDKDITNIPPDEIRTIRVKMTIVGGRIVYQAEP
jgi:hypothetical protein